MSQITLEEAIKEAKDAKKTVCKHERIFEHEDINEMLGRELWYECMDCGLKTPELKVNS